MFLATLQSVIWKMENLGSVVSIPTCRNYHDSHMDLQLLYTQARALNTGRKKLFLLRVSTSVEFAYSTGKPQMYLKSHRKELKDFIPYLPRLSWVRERPFHLLRIALSCWDQKHKVFSAKTLRERRGRRCVKMKKKHTQILRATSILTHRKLLLL